MGAIGGLEESIQKAFRIAGPINAELTADIRPVVMAWDLTSPGYNRYRGRHFGHSAVTNLGVVGASSVAFQCQADVGIIIEEIGVIASGTGGVVVNIRIVSPDVALPYALTARASWTDQYESAADSAPVLSTNALQVDSVLGNPIWEAVTLAASPLTPFTREIHLPLGAFCLIRWSGLCANTGFYFHGRIA